MIGDSTSQFFDVYARDFNAIYGNQNTLFDRVVNRLFRKSMRLRYERTLEGCLPAEGKSVIDIGCGPGHYSVALARRGAVRVLGLDFAKGMIDLATENAKQARVADRCRFVHGDFLKWPIDETFDYAIVMGFMDYIEHPPQLIDRVLSLTRSKAFFSFPLEGGILAWQRKLRYQRRCALYLYTESQLEALFARRPVKNVHLERIARDYFVTVSI